jgi:hypothetical protein
MLPLLAGAVKRAIAGTMTPCSQSQIGHCRHLRRKGTAQVEAASVLSVVVRWRPVRTAVNGTLVARQAGIGGMGGAARSCLDRRARPVLGSHRIVGNPRSGAAVVASGPVADASALRSFDQEAVGQQSESG